MEHLLDAQNSASPHASAWISLTTDQFADLCLQQGLQFTITPSTFAEDLDKYLFDTPAGYVSETARLKVLEVYKRLEEVH